MSDNCRQGRRPKGAEGKGIILMEKIKNRLWGIFGNNFYQKIKDSFSDYAVSLIAIVVTSVYAAFLFAMEMEFDSAFWSEPVFDTIGRGLVCFCFGAVFAETFFTGQKRKKICALFVAAVFAVPLAIGTGLDAETQIFNTSGSILEELTYRFLYGYMLLLTLGTVYFCFKKTGLSFSEYVLKAFSNLMKTFIVFWILSFGVMFITSIVDELLLDDYSYFDMSLEILAVGLYLVPMCLSGLRDMKDEPGAFLKTVVKYILLLLSACGMAIVYLYVLKILILWEMPSNEVFSIVSVLFCFGMPVWLMTEYYADDTRYYKVFSKLPYLFAPLMILQLYSMVVRISQYGVTPGRYMGMMLILFEAVTLFIWHFGKKKREIMLAFLCLLVFIAFWMPGINMYRVSTLCQQSFLKKYYQEVLDGHEISGLAYERLKGSYQYLKSQEQTEAFAMQYDIKEESFVAMLKEIEINDSTLTEYETHDIHCCQMVGELDVEGYREMNMLNQSDLYDSSTDGPFEAFYPNQNGERITVSYASGNPLDFTAFQFIKRETGETITVDISDFAWRCMLYEVEHPDADSDEISDAMRDENCIPIDENTVLYLNHFQIKYKVGVQYGEPCFEWRKPTISGMLLTKE